MLRGLNNLNRRILADDGGIVRGQRYLRYADAARVFGVVGPDDAEDRLHDEGVVFRHGAVAEVDIHQGLTVSTEPARLQADGAASDGPFGAIGGHGHAAAWKGGC